MRYKKRHPFSFYYSFYKKLTYFYNIWPTVYWVNLQHNSYSITRLTYVGHYLGKVSYIVITLATDFTH